MIIRGAVSNVCFFIIIPNLLSFTKVEIRDRSRDQQRAATSVNSGMHR